jgi:predicted metal-dependent peptidase
MEVGMEERERPDIEELKREVMSFVSTMKRMSIVVREKDFYMLLYYFFQGSFDENIDIMAVSYRDTASLGLPRILYGRDLIKYINNLLKRVPNIADSYIKKVRSEREDLPPEYDELLKQYYIFKEIVKHEVIHFINLHVPRTLEFFRKKGFSVVPPQLMYMANIYADSLCNIFLDKKLVEEGGLVPPATENVTLEELLSKIPLKGLLGKQVQLGQEDQQKSQMEQPSSQGQQSQPGQQGQHQTKGKGKGKGDDRSQDIGGEGSGGGEGKEKGEGGGFGEGGFQDFYPEEFDEVGQHDIDRIRDAVRNVLEQAKEAYKRQTGIGNVPGEIEELIKWLKKRRVKLELLDEDNEIFGLFKQLDRTYMGYNPLTSKQMWRFTRKPPIIPVIRQVTGYSVVVVVDTSLSMGEEQLSYAIDMINYLASKARTYLVEIDVDIQRVREIDEIDEDGISFKGRGGTSFKALEKLDEYIDDENVVACILITDGRVTEFPSKNPLPGAKWYGITTDIIPSSSPDWIKWFEVKDVLGEEEEE